jgi:hypothetical protein
VLLTHLKTASSRATSNRLIDACRSCSATLFVVTPLLDRLMDRGHLLKFEGKSW